MIKQFFLALQFLTRIPVPAKLTGQIKESDVASSVMFFPLIGLIIGGILVVVNLGLTFIFPSISTILTLFVYLFLTGALHLDGFVDTVDGLYGGKGKKEEILRIMDDSRIGAIGAVWLGALLILKVVLFFGIGLEVSFSLAIILMCVLSRFGMVLQMFISPAAKTGLASMFCKKISKIEFAVAFIFTLITAVLVSVKAPVLGVKAGAAFFVVIVSGTLIAAYFKKKLSGINGDVIGFSAEIAEIIVLLLLIANFKF